MLYASTFTFDFFFFPQIQGIISSCTHRLIKNAPPTVKEMMHNTEIWSFKYMS